MSSRRVSNSQTQLISGDVSNSERVAHVTVLSLFITNRIRIGIRIRLSPVIVVDSSANWFACVHAAYAFPVVSRHTHLPEGKMSRREMSVPPNVLSTEIFAVDVVYYTYRPFRASWLTAHSHWSL